VFILFYPLTRPPRSPRFPYTTLFRSAPYVTGGVALNLFDVGGPGGSGTQFSLGGGVGTRVPFETAAGRIEGFLGYTFKGGGFPSNFAIGTRIGLSFWH